VTASKEFYWISSQLIPNTSRIYILDLVYHLNLFSVLTSILSIGVVVTRAFEAVVNFHFTFWLQGPFKVIAVVWHLFKLYGV